jgi:hypothetical protein
LIFAHAQTAGHLYFYDSLVAGLGASFQQLHTVTGEFQIQVPLIDCRSGALLFPVFARGSFACSLTGLDDALDWFGKGCVSGLNVFDVNARALLPSTLRSCPCQSVFGVACVMPEADGVAPNASPAAITAASA